VIHQWTPPSLLPLLIPWLGILLLFLLVPENRDGRAWWIWLPLVAVVAAMRSLEWVLGHFPSELQGLLETAFIALGFGHAAVWLLAERLGRRHRVLTFLSIILVLGFASGLTFMVQQDWGEELVYAFFILMPLGLAVLVGAVAISVAGWRVGRELGVVRTSLRLAIVLFALWFLICLPFVVIGGIQSGGDVPWGELAGGLGLMGGLHLATLLPFVVLSFCSGLFHQRLELLLNLDRELPPLEAESAWPVGRPDVPLGKVRGPN
jgi:hypothetical protein